MLWLIRFLHTRIEILMTGYRRTARCPNCGYRSQHRHSHYQRVIQHSPCTNKSVFLVFRLRRYYCRYKKCQKLTFVEYLAPFSERYQRVSTSLSITQTKLAMVAGGEAGSRLAKVFGLRTSGDTLLRRLMSSPEPTITRLYHVGVDDWSYRRGRHYGTLLVDLDTHSPASGFTSQSRPTKPYHQVVKLHQQGLALRNITRLTGLHRVTVRRWLQSDGYPERAQRIPRRSSLIHSWQNWLEKRWQEGNNNARHLWQEMLTNGFTGSESTVRNAVAKWRAHGIPEKNSLRKSESLPSPRKVSRWLTPWRVKPHEQNYATRFITAFCESVPELCTAIALAREFYIMMKDKNHTAFSLWLNKVAMSGVVELKRVTASMESDYVAVREALRSPWSNGVVEGHVNRLKMLKRQIYGRAGFELLRRRVLSTMA